MTEVTVAMILAWWIGVYHMIIAGYLVFLSERRTPLLLMTAVVKGTLGAGIYLVIRQPLWVDAHSPTVPEAVLPTTLIVMLAFSFIVTGLIWVAFDLDPPQQRARKLFHCARKWWERQRQRFGR